MFSLPLNGSAVREMMDINEIAQILAPENRMKMLGLNQAISMSRKFLLQEKTAKSVNAVCMDANGKILFVQIKPNSHKKLWCFN